MNDTILKLLENSEKIVIGLSGGADSVALTHILYKAFSSEKLIVAHLNHMIRGEEALRDEKFVVDFCETFNLEYNITRVDIPMLSKELGISEEECGRKSRYNFFNSLCKENYLIATAHNADDNAETVLFNLIRGTGLKGLCGIPAVRDNIVRPVLDMTRKDIEEYCTKNNLNYVNDSSNFSNDYSRNKIRNCVMPVLKEINLSACENIGRSSAIISKVNNYIGSNAELILSEITHQNMIDCISLRNYDNYIISEVIRLYLIKNDIRSFEERHINKACSLIFSSGAIVLPGEIYLSVKQGRLGIFSKNSFTNELLFLEVDKMFHYSTKCIILRKNKIERTQKINRKLFTNAIDCDIINGNLRIESRKPGDYFYPYGRNVGKSVKKLFNEAKIPSFLRDNVIIIRDDKDIVFIEGFGVSEKYAVGEMTAEYLLVEIEE